MLPNFGVVGPQLYRSGQPDERGFKDAEALRITISYKLNAEFPIEKERKMFRDVVFNPFDGLFRIHDLEKTKTTAGELERLLQGNESVLVHCSHGRDRTGLVVSAWGILYGGWNLADAERERQAFGCNELIDLIDAPDLMILKKIYEMKE